VAIPPSASYSPTLWVWHAGWQDGVTNMSRDDALLEWVCKQPNNTWVLHTYRWQPETLSAGVHQRLTGTPHSISAAWYGYPQRVPVVRRPTGGRAILHGADLSFAIVTNSPAILNRPLGERYARLTKPLHAALAAVGVPIAPPSIEVGDREYAAHALCFASHTPWDILAAQPTPQAPSGNKLAGCAQCVRKGGILQHGAIFVEPRYLEQLPTALEEATSTLLHTSAQAFPPEQATFQPLAMRLYHRYQQQSDELMAHLHATHSLLQPV